MDSYVVGVFTFTVHRNDVGLTETALLVFSMSAPATDDDPATLWLN